MKVINAVCKHVENYFWFWCIFCTVLGIWCPGPFVYIQHTFVLNLFLMGILFFTCLKIDFIHIITELKRYLFVGYLTVIILIIMPVATYAAAYFFMPEWALGFLILAAVPAGMAGGTLTDLCKGNTTLALTVTTVTSLICPFTIPPLVKYLSDRETSASILLAQIGTLMVLIFIPLICSQVVKKAAPRLVSAHYGNLSGLSIISLCLLILGAMSKSSDTVVNNLDQAGILLGALFLFSAFFHIAGFFIPAGKPLEDRVAVSVNMAYVNNGLAIVFAMMFFKDKPAAVLPCVFIEFPMIIMIVPLKYLSQKLKAKGLFAGPEQNR
ncbi:bile acid:sodium symporter family protein [Planctomycetota bacterium]